MDSIRRRDDLRAIGRDDGEWVDESGRIRVLLGDERVVLRFQLLEESAESFARELDRLYETAFEIARAARLDVVDPQLSTVVTPFRFESQFPRILEAWSAHTRTALALQRDDAWSEVSSETAPLAMPSEAPAFEAYPDQLPTTLWSRRVRKVGPLEFHGPKAAAAFADVAPGKEWVAIVAPKSTGGDDVALLRVNRVSRPIAGVVVVEGLSAGLTRSIAIERLGEGAVRVRF